MAISPAEAAEVLAELYDMGFCGKEKGRYKITRADLAEISGRSVIKQSIIDEIADDLAEEHGLIMIDLGVEFPIVKKSVLQSYRSVTSKVVQEKSPK